MTTAYSFLAGILSFGITLASTYVYAISQEPSPNPSPSVAVPEADAPVPAVLDQDHFRVGDMILEKVPAQPQPQMFFGLDGDATQFGATNFPEFSTRPWINGVVPLQFTNLVSVSSRQLIFNACSRWGRVAHVRCVYRSREPNFLSVTTYPDGCYTTVGMQRGPSQINLADGCWYPSTILHEMGHALGLIHEHMRPDRDRYIRINFSNILLGEEPQFHIAFNATLRSQYDFYSIMHYTAYAFAKDQSRRTITARPGFERYQHVIDYFDKWNRQISRGDAQAVSSIYGQP